jgi:hypothetical protein
MHNGLIRGRNRGRSTVLGFERLPRLQIGRHGSRRLVPHSVERESMA